MPCTFAYNNRKTSSFDESQLEDYPRGSVLNPDYEIHLDL